ncbi:E3 ubiquitin-protein ligase RNF115/126 [Pelomyxa schiedti]|nr:E3 ubiquitin-protein ligase RNF115/126 [Pelomyxa schiedti]
MQSEAGDDAAGAVDWPQQHSNNVTAAPVDPQPTTSAFDGASAAPPEEGGADASCCENNIDTDEEAFRANLAVPQGRSEGDGDDDDDDDDANTGRRPDDHDGGYGSEEPDLLDSSDGGSSGGGAVNHGDGEYWDGDDYDDGYADEEYYNHMQHSPATSDSREEDENQNQNHYHDRGLGYRYGDGDVDVDVDVDGDGDGDGTGPDTHPPPPREAHRGENGRSGGGGPGSYGDDDDGDGDYGGGATAANAGDDSQTDAEDEDENASFEALERALAEFSGGRGAASTSAHSYASSSEEEGEPPPPQQQQQQQQQEGSQDAFLDDLPVLQEDQGTQQQTGTGEPGGRRRTRGLRMVMEITPVVVVPRGTDPARVTEATSQQEIVSSALRALQRFIGSGGASTGGIAVLSSGSHSALPGNMRSNTVSPMESLSGSGFLVPENQDVSSLRDIHLPGGSRPSLSSILSSITRSAQTSGATSQPRPTDTVTDSASEVNNTDTPSATQTHTANTSSPTTTPTEGHTPPSEGNFEYRVQTPVYVVVAEIRLPASESTSGTATPDSQPGVSPGITLSGDRLGQVRQALTRLALSRLAQRLRRLSGGSTEQTQTPETEGVGDYALTDDEFERILDRLFHGAQHDGPPPASPQAIATMLQSVCVSQDAVDHGEQCAVCREELTLSETVSCLPCKHLYHDECIKPWLALHNSCPCCRSQLPTPPASDEKCPTTPADSDPASTTPLPEPTTILPTEHPPQHSTTPLPGIPEPITTTTPIPVDTTLTTTTEHLPGLSQVLSEAEADSTTNHSAPSAGTH